MKIWKGPVLTPSSHQFLRFLRVEAQAAAAQGNAQQFGPIPQPHQCGHEGFHIDLEQPRAKARFQSTWRSFRQQPPTLDKAYFSAALHLVHVMRSNKDRFSLVTQVIE